MFLFNIWNFVSYIKLLWEKNVYLLKCVLSPNILTLLKRFPNQPNIIASF